MHVSFGFGFTRCASVFAALSLYGCAPSDGPGETESADETIIGVSLPDGTQARFVEGDLPEAEADVEFEASEQAQAVTGGTTSFPIDLPEGATAIYTAVGDQDGYWLLELPEGTDPETVLVTWAEMLPPGLDVRVAVADAAGKVSEPLAIAAETLTVGVGDVQVNVSWDADVDLDLHVVDPNGFEVFHEQRSSPEGGTLDLDANSFCNIDGVNNENIVWPEGSAPEGEYVVRVDHFNNCTEAASRFVVTVNVAGQAPQLFTGGFAADEPGTQGSAGAGIEVARFTVP